MTEAHMRSEEFQPGGIYSQFKRHKAGVSERPDTNEPTLSLAQFRFLAVRGAPRGESCEGVLIEQAPGATATSATGIHISDPINFRGIRMQSSLAPGSAMVVDPVQVPGTTLRLQ